MKIQTIIALLSLCLMACSSEKDSSRGLEGLWNATWEIDPAGYPDIKEQMDFTMHGQFIIDADSITIEGYGYRGCIFSEDTIHHKLMWKVQNDSLLLFNDSNMPGLVYKIVEFKDRSLKLQLEDIFVTLSK